MRWLLLVLLAVGCTKPISAEHVAQEIVKRLNSVGVVRAAAECPNAPARKRNEAHDGLQDARLAGAVRTDERDDFAPPHGERDALHGGDAAVRNTQSIELEIDGAIAALAHAFASGAVPF